MLNNVKNFYYILVKEFTNCEIFQYKILYIKKDLIEINTNIKIDNNKHLIIYLKFIDNEIKIYSNLKKLKTLSKKYNLNRINDIKLLIDNTELIIKYQEEKNRDIIKLLICYIYDILLEYKY